MAVTGKWRGCHFKNFKIKENTDRIIEDNGSDLVGGRVV